MSTKNDSLPSCVEKGTEGFVFATTGEKYTVLARRAARTIRQHMPNCNIDLFTDQDISDDVFNRIHHLDHGWFRPKMQAIRESRFERSVILDADIVITTDISEVFQILDKCDIAGVEAVYRGSYMMQTEGGVPRCFPPVNSGFLVVKASNKLCRFASKWQEDVRDRNLKKDQPALRELLYNERDLKFCHLGAEYNLICGYRLDSWRQELGAPRVLHVPKLHMKPPGDPTSPITLADALGSKQVSKIEKLLESDDSIRRVSVLRDHCSQRIPLEQPVKSNSLAESTKIPKIAHLIIVAAPSGSGKSSLLSDPKKYLSFTPKHEDLVFLNQTTIPHRVIMGTKGFDRRRIPQLILHVDLCSLILQECKASTLVDLKRFVDANPYSQWKRLSAYRDAALKISVVTLFVERETNHERWTSRRFEENSSSGKVTIQMAGILGYSKDNSAIHRGLYKSWAKTVEAMSPSSHLYLDINGTDYSLMNDEQITNALEFGKVNKDRSLISPDFE